MEIEAERKAVEVESKAERKAVEVESKAERRVAVARAQVDPLADTDWDRLAAAVVPEAHLVLG